MPKRPPLTVKQITSWVKAHQQRTGRRLHAGTGKISDAPQETWRGINSALMKGHRELPGGSSLSGLLDKHCGLQLTLEKVLSWMKHQRRRTGRWPVVASGVVRDAPGENWLAIDNALRYRSRGLPAGLFLRQLRLLLVGVDLV